MSFMAQLGGRCAFYQQPKYSYNQERPFAISPWGWSLWKYCNGVRGRGYMCVCV